MSNNLSSSFEKKYPNIVGVRFIKDVTDSIRPQEDKRERNRTICIAMWDTGEVVISATYRRPDEHYDWKLAQTVCLNRIEFLNTASLDGWRLSQTFIDSTEVLEMTDLEQEKIFYKELPMGRIKSILQYLTRERVTDIVNKGLPPAFNGLELLEEESPTHR
jgi:hypothetical protein